MSKALSLLKNDALELATILSMNGDYTDAKTRVMLELDYLQEIMIQQPTIESCEPESIVRAVRGVLSSGLTLNPRDGLVYVKTRNAKVKGKWVKLLEIKESPEGTIYLYRKSNLIPDFEKPKLVKNDEGMIIGGTINICVKGVDGYRWEEYEYDESDINRWKKASHKERSRGKEDVDDEAMNYANSLYTSQNGGIDSEFMRAKIIQHSFKKRGKNINDIQEIPIIKEKTFHNIEDQEITQQNTASASVVVEEAVISTVSAKGIEDLDI